MNSIRNYSVPPEFGQGSYMENWLSNADIALFSGSPHLANCSPLDGQTAPGVGLIGNMTAAETRSASDLEAMTVEEFKKQVVSLLIQRDTEMCAVLKQAEAMRIRIDAVEAELLETKAALNEERKWREEITSVMMAKERNEKEERERRDMEKRSEDENWPQRDEWRREQERIVARIEEEEETLRELVEKRFDNKERKEDEKTVGDVLETEKAEEKEKVEKVMQTDIPSSGMHTPDTRIKTTASRGSGGITCFNCHQEGHYARDCVDLHVKCESCGGFGHSFQNCLPSKRCYNCSKSGHRHFECTEKDRRRCFYCRQVGHLAMDCTNAPKQ